MNTLLTSRWPFAGLAPAILLLGLPLQADPPAAPQGEVGAGIVAGTRTRAKELIERALTKRVTLDATEVKLAEVLKQLGTQAGVAISIDAKALADVGIDRETPVTAKLGPMRLEAVLRHVLRPLDLTHCVRNEVLLVTTPEEANSKLETRVYRVKGLIEVEHADPAAPPEYDFDSLIDVITASVEPTTWEDVGGPGSIDHFGTSLVVSQTREVHREVEGLLTMLLQARELHAKWDGKTRAPALLGGAAAFTLESEEERRIAKVLAEPATWEFKDTPLATALEQIAAGQKITIVLDRKALADVGIGDDTPLTDVAEQASLGAALRRLLRMLDLTYHIRSDALVVTTSEEASAKLPLRFYPVFDLVEEKLGLGHPAMRAPLVGGAGGVGRLGNSGGIGPAAPGAFETFANRPEVDFDPLKDLVTSTIAPTTWEDVGGPGTIRSFLPGRVLVISTVEEEHEAIAKLLARLRETTPVPARITAEEIEKFDRQVVSHVFMLIPGTPERPVPEPKELADALRTAVTPEVWKAEGHSIVAVQGRLRVTAPRKTLREAEKVLRELNVVVPTVGGGGNFAM